VIRKRAVVYVGLDALSDAEVAAAVGNSMFSDLVSVAGHIYKHGIDDGLPGASAGSRVPINVHADEFNELMGDEFVPLINKGGGAGLQVTAYTQTLSDIEARIGNRAKAGQVIGNFNNLFMLRVRETATAELLTRQLPKVEVYKDSFARMEARTGKQYDAMIDLDITSPLRTEQDIENAFAKAQEREDLQIIFSVCEARRNPWFNMFKIVGDHAEMVIESQFTGRQQAPEVYDVNASIYVIRRAFLVDNPDPILWHSKFGVSVMMDTGIIDIDSEHDYLLMEAIAQHLYAHYPEFNAVRENIRG